LKHWSNPMSEFDMVTLPKRVAKRLSRWLQTGFGMSEKWLYVYGLRSTQTLCLPDFLCIGAQKAGTTWLFTNLRSHPGIYLPEEALHYDLHYFDLEFHKSLKFYAKKFEPGRQMMKGESTPAYGVVPLSRIRFVRAVIPDVRLIFMMRNPIERAWSHALMGLVKRANRKFDEIDDSEFFAHFSSERSRKRGDYVTILDNWLSVFSREQLYIGFFEDIVNHPQKLLSEVFAHVGISQDVDWDSFPYKRVINKGPGIPMPKKFRAFLEEMYYQKIEILYERFGDPVADWLCS